MPVQTDSREQSKSKPPVRRNPDASRERILAAATDVFAAQGLDGARVDEIADRAGLNKRMLYYYFGNKDDLFAAVLDEVYETICTQSAALDVVSGSAPSGLSKLVDFVIDFYLDNPHAITLLNAENLHKARHLKTSERIRAIRPPFEEMLNGLLARGVAENNFRKGVNGARLYISIVGLIYYYLSNGNSLSVFFDRDLFDETEVNAWRAHIHEMVDRFVAA
ncbi:MAG: TetR family transcriptional regulator [Alphaproteobacteria bacterium]